MIIHSVVLINRLSLRYEIYLFPFYWIILGMGTLHYVCYHTEMMLFLLGHSCFPTKQL